VTEAVLRRVRVPMLIKRTVLPLGAVRAPKAHEDVLPARPPLR
jgi:hypothetical protein